MQHLAPVEHDGLLERLAEEIEIGLVGEQAGAVELGHPHRHRRAVGDQAEPLLALAQGFLRQHAVGDVDMGADEPQRAALRIALDLGDDIDPPDLAVVRPDDAVLRAVLLALTRQRVEELFQRWLAIVGMDAVDPVLVGLVPGVGRQAVDDEVFGRAPILEAFAKIDFDAADLADALDARQLRLALLQRAKGVIAFPRKRLDVVPKLLRQRGVSGQFGRLRGRHSGRALDQAASEPAFAMASSSAAGPVQARMEPGSIGGIEAAFRATLPLIRATDALSR